MPGLSNLLVVDVIPMINLFNYDFLYIYIYSCIGLLHFLLIFSLGYFPQTP